MEERTIFYNGRNWQYFITYKQQKNLYLKLKGSKIIVSAPFFVKQEVIEDFVQENITKLTSKIKDYQLHHDLVISKIAFFPEPFIYFLDKKLVMVGKYQKQTKFYLSDDVFFIYSPFSFHSQNDQLFLLKKVNIFLKKLAKPIFQERLNYWQVIMNLKVNSFEVRLMKNKWGVCFHELKKITLNLKLVHFSYQVIDYVVIHELAHLVYPNHNKDFWNLVALYCPDYKSCKNILKYSNVGISNEKN